MTPGTDTACESRFPPFTPYELPLRTAGFGTCLCLPSFCLHSGPGSWAVLGAPQQTKRSSPAVHPHGLLCLAAATCRIPLLPPLCPLSPLTTGMEALVLEGTSVCACAAAGPWASGSRVEVLRDPRDGNGGLWAPRGSRRLGPVRPRESSWAGLRLRPLVCFLCPRAGCGQEVRLTSGSGVPDAPVSGTQPQAGHHLRLISACRSGGRRV